MRDKPLERGAAARRNAARPAASAAAGGASAAWLVAAALAAAALLLFLAAAARRAAGGGRLDGTGAGAGAGFLISSWRGGQKDTLVLYLYRPRADAEAPANFRYFLLAGVLDAEWRADTVVLVPEEDKVRAFGGGLEGATCDR